MSRLSSRRLLSAGPEMFDPSREPEIRDSEAGPSETAWQVSRLLPPAAVIFAFRNVKSSGYQGHLTRMVSSASGRPWPGQNHSLVVDSPDISARSVGGLAHCPSWHGQICEWWRFCPSSPAPRAAPPYEAGPSVIFLGNKSIFADVVSGKAPPQPQVCQTLDLFLMSLVSQGRGVSANPGTPRGREI